MATPPLAQKGSPASTSGGLRSPGSWAMEARAGSALADDAIWRRLREPGFDEEMIKRRDKAALIAYITKLETEIYDYQHHMGLLILERKEWTSKYEQVKAAADFAEFTYKRDQAAQTSALAESRKREESLKKALGIEKECIANLEKALHAMRAESAETKVAAESKLAEAHTMMENAQMKLDEAQSKLHAAESLHTEASRHDRTATRKLQEVEAREDELRRRLILFKSECDAKEKDISLERQSLYNSQKIVQQEQEKLLERQSSLNQREEYIFARSQELNHFEKELEAAKANLEKEVASLKEEKSSLGLDMAALASREEAIIEREALLDRREWELLVQQEKLASKEHDMIQSLTNKHQSALEKRKSEFEAELVELRKSVDAEVEMKRLTSEQWETDLRHREEVIQERENALELQLSALVEKEMDAAEKVKLLEEKEQNIAAAEKVTGEKILGMKKEKEEIESMKLNLEKVKESLDVEKKQALQVQEKLEVTVDERNNLLVLETRLKEEIDSFRAQKMELITEVDKLRSEKEKFEHEWELIDEKREELLKEAEQIAEERKYVSNYFKNEHESLKFEKDKLRNQFKSDLESLSCEREEFMSMMKNEHSDWFSKIQQEREDFVEDMKLQKRELENCISKRREEVEAYLRGKEEAFEQEKAKELQQLNSRKVMIAKDLEYVNLEMKRLDNERREIAVDREQREREWSEIKSSIDELNIQREKLQKQRELLHVDREDINAQIEQLKKLEDLNIALENRALSEIQSHHVNTLPWKVPLRKCSNPRTPVLNTNVDHNDQTTSTSGGFEPDLSSKKTSGSASMTLTWVRRCAELIFKQTPEKVAHVNSEKNVKSKISAHPEEMSPGFELEPAFSDALAIKNSENAERINSKGREEKGRICETQTVTSILEESKVILEVPSSYANIENTDNLEFTNSRDKKDLIQLNEFSVQDMNEERFKFTDDGGNSLKMGRKRVKRPNNSLSRVDADVHREPNLKYQKRSKQNKFADGALMEEISSSCVINQTSGGREVSGIDKVLEIPKFSEDIEASSKQAKNSLDASSVLHCDNVEDGVSLGNGILSSSCPETFKSQEKELDTVLSTSVEKLSNECQA